MIRLLNRIALRAIVHRQVVRFGSSLGTASDVANNIFKFREHSADEGYVWNSPYERVAIPDMTVDEYVWKNMAKWPNKIATVCAVTGRKYTYAKMRDHCAALAIRLRTEYDLNQGDIVAICLPNVPGTFLCEGQQTRSGS